LALARLQALHGGLNYLDALLTARDLGRDVQLGLVGFVGVGDIGLCRAFQQGLDLRLEFKLRGLHALVAHGLVLARARPKLGAVHANRAQLERQQPVLIRGLGLIAGRHAVCSASAVQCSASAVQVSGSASAVLRFCRADCWPARVQ